MKYIFLILLIPSLAFGEDIFCDVCGRKLTENGLSIIGMRISRMSDQIEKSNEYRRIKDTFGKTEFNICWVDFIKSLGVKTLDKHGLSPADLSIGFTCKKNVCEPVK